MNTFIRILAIFAIIMTVACAGGTDSGTGDTEDQDRNQVPDVWDVDGDGFCAQAYQYDSRCTNQSEYDCNDNNDAVYPGSTEDCTNTIDDNCDGQVNEGCPCTQIMVYADEDGDGYGDGTTPETYCQDADHDGYVTNDDDCDDTNAAINPDAAEICGNDVDENCNGYAADCQCTEVVYYQDADGDGYGNGQEPETFCQGDDHTGYVENDDDCDDGSAVINPDADEVCGNSVDENCDDIAPACDCNQIVLYEDADGDGYGNAASPETFCEGWTHDGYVDNTTDCDDTDAAQYPGAAGDNDCTPVINVSTAAELTAALADAEPGDTITLAPGTYTGWFIVEKSGLAGQPITITGPTDGTAHLIGEGIDTGDKYHGTLEIRNQAYIVAENLEITNPVGNLGVLLTGPNGDQEGDGCAHITLRNLYVHDLSDEGIKIRNQNTHDILVEHNRVHSTAGSSIDVQGGTKTNKTFPDPETRPERIVIRNNLIWDTNFAGIGNELGNRLHIYNNIILGSRMGLDIGCGDNIVIRKNLITSYAHYANLLTGAPTVIDFDKVARHTVEFNSDDYTIAETDTCKDGIAVSGTYMTLIYDNEITGCNGDSDGGGDLLISYNHQIDGTNHNISNDSEHKGHQYNLFFRNLVHDNEAYKTIEEFPKQTGAIVWDNIYYNNLFAYNGEHKAIRFEDSKNLIFANNTIVGGDQVTIEGTESTGAIIKSNIFCDTADVSVGSGVTGTDISNNAVISGPNTIFVNAAEGDYHLKASVVAGDIGTYTGIDISGTLAATFGKFDAAYLDASKYNWHDDFTTDIVFDYRKDFDGNTRSTTWYVGAYAVPQ